MRRKSLSLYALISCCCFGLTAWATQSRPLVYASDEQPALGSAGFEYSSTKPVVSNLPTDSPTPLRILSWNIQFGKGTDGLTNYDRTSVWIVQINPDLVALSEVPPEGIPLLVSSLHQKTGRTWYSHWVPKFVGCAEGNLILSKYSFQSVDSRFLSYNRSVAQVAINVGGRVVNFLLLILTTDRRRAVQLKLESFLTGLRGLPSQEFLLGILMEGPTLPRSPK